MREFFHGWRRKVGCLMLVMGLALMVGWLRSRVVSDGLVLQSNEEITRYLLSSEGNLHLIRCLDKRQGPKGSLIHWVGNPRPGNVCYITEMPDMEWRWHAAGFGIGHLDLPQLDFTIWSVPYWFPTGSLAIVSAWLLLSRGGLLNAKGVVYRSPGQRPGFEPHDNPQSPERAT